MSSLFSSRQWFALQFILMATICLVLTVGVTRKATAAEEGPYPEASVTLQTVVVDACGNCDSGFGFAPITVLGITVQATGDATLVEEVATMMAKDKAQLLENSSTCKSVGNAQSPQYYQQLGENAAATPYSLATETIILTQFYHGGPFDAQASGSSPAYANYVFGVYMAAIGWSLNTALSGANSYAGLFANYNWSLVGPADPTYTNIPHINVENITFGYNAEKSGTLCAVSSSSG